MFKSLQFLIYCALLLTKYTQVKSVSTEGTESLLPINQYNDSRKAFQDAVITKFAILSEGPVKLGMQLLQDTCDDDLDDEVKHFLAQTLVDYRNITSEVKKIQFFLRLCVAFDFYSGTIAVESEEKTFVSRIQEALQRHDVEGVAIEFQKNYNEFFKWLTLEIDAYSTKFNSEDKLKVNRFKNLCLQFKEESDNRLSLVDHIVARL